MFLDIEKYTVPRSPNKLGVALFNEKRDRLLEATRLRTITSFRSALELFNYYHKHMASLSKVLLSLDQLLEGKHIPKTARQTLRLNEFNQLALTSTLQLLQETTKTQSYHTLSPSLVPYH